MLHSFWLGFPLVTATALLQDATIGLFLAALFLHYFPLRKNLEFYFHLPKVHFEMLSQPPQQLSAAKNTYLELWLRKQCWLAKHQALEPIHRCLVVSLSFPHFLGIFPAPMYHFIAHQAFNVLYAYFIALL